MIPTWAVEKKGISYQKQKYPPNFNKGVGWAFLGDHCFSTIYLL